jgi:two-component system, NtrC family, response regulator HydG
MSGRVAGSESAAGDDFETRVRARLDDEGCRGVACSYILEVLEGPNAGTRIDVDVNRPSPLLVGQSPACDLELGDRLVSRRHAAFEPSPLGLRLTDLGSTNGTRVQDVQVVEAYLSGGELVRLGDTVLRVLRGEASPDPPASQGMRFGKVIGASFAMQRLYPLCQRLAHSDVPLIIEGETGTGKEQLAEALHEASSRAAAPFVVFDCTATAPSLLESALFGHERGAFTGAVSTKKGCFELANNGTLLIDEIGDLDLALQAKLLRAIERQEIQRVGGERWRSLDVRIMAATRRNLEQEVQAGRFRDDLFYRLAVARIELPPLRRREGDVSLLARHFWRLLGGHQAPPEEFFQKLESYDWPGNVRELHNAVLRRVALGELGETPLRNSAPPVLDSPSSDSIDRVLERDLPFPRARDEIVAEFERRYVDRVLARYDGNVVRAAAASGIARRYFQIIRRRHGKADTPGNSE